MASSPPPLPPRNPHPVSDMATVDDLVAESVGRSDQPPLAAPEVESPTTMPPLSLLRSRSSNEPLVPRSEPRTSPKAAPPPLPPRTQSALAPPPALPSRDGRPAQAPRESSFAISTLTTPSVLFPAVLALLAYARISAWLIVVIAGVGLAAVWQTQEEERAKCLASEKMDDTIRASGHHPVPAFVNYTIARLWPIVSPDLFVPMIDLLEDALAEECPAIVHSVRVETLLLGTTPVDVRHIRAMSDQEWFEGLGGGGSHRAAQWRAVNGEEAEIEGGDYANFEVNFELSSGRGTWSENAGLLLFMGVGLQGVGGVEVPIWIDLLRVSGLLRLRLLLDPAPPFVRTGTMSFPVLPQIDISARPLKRSGLGSINALKLPGLKTYVLSAITRVAAAFVSPSAYTVDLDRLLTGEEGLTTRQLGVVVITLHSAESLRAADRNGLSDPYCAISFGNHVRKPLFSTKTIEKTLNPVWEETAFLLVPADAVETGERLVVSLYDSDKFNSDDALGKVEVDLGTIVNSGSKASSSSEIPRVNRRDDLQPARKGGKAKGTLVWSIQFYPIWTPKSVEPTNEIDPGSSPAPTNLAWPIFHRVKETVLNPEPFEWEEERLKRRQDSVKWLKGERKMEALQARAKPSRERRSGILAWNIIQCQNLQVRAESGDFDGGSRSHAGGKPALSDQLDAVEGEEEEAPVSSYVEVILNDRLVYRTRTKRLSNSPYVNASTERFIRDFTTERVVFVVREQREREHDPVLGLVSFASLEEAFGEGSDVTKWYPLNGGLGLGTIRLSLTWKAVDLSLPRGISGFDVVSTDIHSLNLVGISPQLAADLDFSHVALETESDGRIIDPSSNKSSSHARSPSRKSFSSPRSSVTIDQPVERAFPLPSTPTTLACRYRSSTSLVIRFFTREGTIKKKNVTWGIGLVRLADLPDSTRLKVGVPIWPTASLALAMECAFGKTGDRERPLREVATLMVDLQLRPGLGKAHARLAKRDSRFASVAEINRLIASTDEKSSQNPNVLEDRPTVQVRSEEAEVEVAGGEVYAEVYDSSASGWSSRHSDDESDSEAEVAEGGWFSRLKKRSRENRQQQSGAHRHKAVRSATWAADKVASTAANASSSIGKHKRREGVQHSVEREGISSF